MYCKHPDSELQYVIVAPQPNLVFACTKCSHSQQTQQTRYAALHPAKAPAIARRSCLARAAQPSCMPYEPEDEAGWNALPTASSDDEAESAENSIGPLHTQNEAYTYRSRHFAGLQELSIVSQPEKGLSFQIWPSALSLSTYAGVQHQQQAQHWKGKRIIELGAGCGLVGLAFAALGANVLLTDLPNVLSLLEKNISLNEATILGGGGTAQACELTWGKTPVEVLPQAWASPDLVVAADVIYHRELFGPLLTCLQGFGSTRIILAHVRRWKSDAAFFKQAKKMFDVTDITQEIDPDAGRLSSHTQGAPRLFSLEAKA